MEDSVDLREGNYCILMSFIFFQMLNFFLKWYGPPKSLKDDVWMWRNLFVSQMHSTCSSIFISLSILLYPELLASPMEHMNRFTYFTVALTAGYFCYDFLDIFLNGKQILFKEVIGHHIICIGISYYNMCIKSMIGFNIIAMVPEINSVFLHWRKLLKMNQTPINSLKYKVIKYLNLFTFVLFRLGSCIYVTVCIYYYTPRLSWFYLIMICCVFFFIDGMNVVLFWRVFKSDILGAPRASKKESGINTTPIALKTESDIMGTPRALKKESDILETLRASKKD